MTLTRLERILLAIAPQWAQRRVRARMMTEFSVRHFDAAQPTLRTQGWMQNFADADANIRGANLMLRNHARDLIRNNSWAKKAQQVVTNGVVRWGITPKAVGASKAQLKRTMDLWKAWANTKDCDAAGRSNFSTLQTIAMKGVFEGGEVLLRRRARRPSDGLDVPLQIQLLEADYLDTARNFLGDSKTGPTVQGIEFDLIGRRTAYWLFDQHPGSGRNYSPSRRIPASEVIHIYRVDRVGQSRGLTWLAPVILSLKDFDEYEDATIVRQKMAACFSGWISDPDGISPSIGLAPSSTQFPTTPTLEPGVIQTLPTGKQITFASPPAVPDESFTTRTMRKTASGTLITYEDLTGDYSQVNYSSARMARNGFLDNIEEWRWAMFVPQMCEGVWEWFTAAANIAGEISEIPAAEWTCPPAPMLEPDKEGIALQRMVRIGAKTHSQMVRDMGEDPEQHWNEYASDNETLDSLGIVLDSDPRKTTTQGLAQPEPSVEGENTKPVDSKP